MVKLCEDVEVDGQLMINPITTIVQYKGKLSQE